MNSGGSSAPPPPVSAVPEEATVRFRSVVETLEAALFLNRPMDGLVDAVKEKVGWIVLRLLFVLKLETKGSPFAT